MRQFLVGLLIGLLVMPAPLSGAKRKARSGSHRRVARSSRAHAGGGRRAVHSRTSRGRRRTSRGRRQILSRQTHPDPERTRVIQEALAREGYLTGSPNGKWDGATQEAMARYQKDHGFTVTGKPDARSLIKLGLGPDYEHVLNPPPPARPPSPTEN